MKIGRTESHLVVVAGPWSVWSPTDSTSRYPDVAGVMPKRATTTVVIDEHDAVELLKVLPTLPGNSDDNRPVTIETNTTVTIRGGAQTATEKNEFQLVRSRATGAPACLTLDRRHLARALSLGCHALKLAPDKPFVLEGKDVSFGALPLGTLRSSSQRLLCPRHRPLRPSDPHTPTTLVRNQAMEPPKLNGHTPPRGDPSDPLFAAEELRDTLSEASNKAARLVAILKATRKEKRVLASVLANLKQLGLDSGASP
ncbi:MAG: hypothetical protein U0792_19625 [Gemmataceae bacterium]